LRELERRFGDELVVVGVHAGKFRAERLTRNIAQAVARYHIEHPVVNDRQYRIWRAYGVQAWPTIVLIDATGDYVGTLPGEFTAEQLAPRIEGLIAGARAAGHLRPGPPPLRLPQAQPGPLAFPAKVLALSRGRVFVADTGHHRVLELEVVSLEPPRARVRRVIGGPDRGFADGGLEEARFDHPHGMRLLDERLYVADTDNHALRVVDLARGTVATLAGSGEQARGWNVAGRGREVALNSPWDLVAAGGTLVVAMAGFHQLWTVDPLTGEAAPLLGTGREDLSDGPAFRCTLAQPTGLAGSGERLFVADSESSAVREADHTAGGWEVRTIVGQGLFEFGDQDGKGGRVRLQHPYGLTLWEGLLYVADTYNNRIKRLEPATGVCETSLGDGEEGLVDGAAVAARFDEPQDVSAADGLLVVADTNNHALRVADLAAHGEPVVRTLILESEGQAVDDVSVR
jgi:hypothetical protein